MGWGLGGYGARGGGSVKSTRYQGHCVGHCFITIKKETVSIIPKSVGWGGVEGGERKG